MLTIVRIQFFYVYVNPFIRLDSDPQHYVAVLEPNRDLNPFDKPVDPNFFYARLSGCFRIRVLHAGFFLAPA